MESVACKNDNSAGPGFMQLLENLVYPIFIVRGSLRQCPILLSKLYSHQFNYLICCQRVNSSFSVKKNNKLLVPKFLTKVGNNNKGHKSMT